MICFKGKNKRWHRGKHAAIEKLWSELDNTWGGGVLVHLKGLVRLFVVCDIDYKIVLTFYPGPSLALILC